jgi:hypothetical protein
MVSLKHSAEVLLSLLLLGGAVQSCSLGDDDLMASYAGTYTGKYNAIVTVKQNEEGKPFFQLDESITLEPVGWENPFKTETRAFLNYTELPDAGTICPKTVRVDEIEEILTLKAVTRKTPVNDFGKQNDPLVITNDWMTCFEDGFITVHIAAPFEAEPETLDYSLEVDPSNPLEFYFKHYRNGESGKTWKEFIVAFDVREFLPEAGEDYVANLHVYSYYGFLSIPFPSTRKWTLGGGTTDGREV